MPRPAIRAACARGRATTRRGTPATRPLGPATRSTAGLRYDAVGATTRHPARAVRLAWAQCAWPGRSAHAVGVQPGPLGVHLCTNPVLDSVHCFSHCLDHCS